MALIYCGVHIIIYNIIIILTKKNKQQTNTQKTTNREKCFLSIILVSVLLTDFVIWYANIL